LLFAFSHLSGVKFRQSQEKTEEEQYFFEDSTYFHCNMIGTEMQKSMYTCSTSKTQVFKKVI